MTHFLLLILVFFGVALYFMTPAERTRLFQFIAEALRSAKDAIALDGLQRDPFFEALRARTPRALATPCLIALSTIVFFDSPVLELFISAVCAWQIGLILERLVGRLAFVTVYIASCIAPGMVSLSAAPGGLSVGASAPVVGMYGLLLVTSTASLIHRSSLTISLHAVKRLAPVAAVFLLYKVATTGLGHVADVAALTCGLVGGIVIAREVRERTPQMRRLATAMATVVTVASVYAVIAVQRPRNDTVDVRWEIDRVIAAEIRTAGLYDKEVDRFRKGRMTAAGLAEVIEKTIVPELHVAARRLGALPNVSPEHKALITSAEAFLTLRAESWQLRAVALQKSDMHGLRQADSKEQASRGAFNRLKPAMPHDAAGEPSS